MFKIVNSGGDDSDDVNGDDFCYYDGDVNFDSESSNAVMLM